MGQPPTPAQVRLLAILRGLRDGAGLTTYQLAERLRWNQSKVTRAENGRVRLSAAEVTEWAQATGADEATREELSQLAYAAATEARSWHISHRGGLAARQNEMARMDRAATQIAHFQPSVIPGLLQSESYARRVMTMSDVSGKGGIDAGVKARMKRQAILRQGGRRFDYVLTEAALRWRPGPRQVMEEQLGKLLASAALPSVSLSVIPLDREARTWYSQGFAVFRGMPDGPEILTEGYTKEDFLRDERDVETYERIFALLRESALTGSDAVEFARAAILG